ncbi:MAG: haloacid dehalogenase type II [Rubrivivax sp.]|nr:haloacid dehalogenase type II [Rubrivivax sp.]
MEKPADALPKLPAPRAVLFDAYGTLFDVYSVAQLAEQLFPGHGPTLSLVWRDKQIEYTRLVTTSRRYGQLGTPDISPPFYRPFGELTRAALVYAIKRIANNDLLTLGKTEFDSKVDQLMAQYHQLDVFADVREVLTTLKARGIPTGILSNGDPEMLGAVVRNAGLADLLDHVISVDRVRHYKTHPEAYGLGVHAIGAPPGQIVFVSSNSWDALGAAWFGYTTLWVNRAGLPFEELGTQPTRTASSLGAVLDFFPA